jgi:hypothetical protein
MADEVLRFLKLLRTNGVADQRATQIFLRYRRKERKGRSQIDEASRRVIPTAGAEAAAKADPERDDAGANPIKLAGHGTS